MNGVDYLRNLYITPDLTPAEREQNKALRSKLKEMNQQGNRYRIKNGQIVLREKQAPSAQLGSGRLCRHNLKHNR